MSINEEVDLYDGLYGNDFKAINPFKQRDQSLSKYIPLKYSMVNYGLPSTKDRKFIEEFKIIKLLFKTCKYFEFPDNVLDRAVYIMRKYDKIARGEEQKKKNAVAYIILARESLGLPNPRELWDKLASFMLEYTEDEIKNDKQKNREVNSFKYGVLHIITDIKNSGIVEIKRTTDVLDSILDIQERKLAKSYLEKIKEIRSKNKIKISDSLARYLAVYLTDLKLGKPISHEEINRKASTRVRTRHFVQLFTKYISLDVTLSHKEEGQDESKYYNAVLSIISGEKYPYSTEIKIYNTEKRRPRIYTGTINFTCKHCGYKWSVDVYDGMYNEKYDSYLYKIKETKECPNCHIELNKIEDIGISPKLNS